MVAVLGIEASPDLLRSWAGWLAPDPQPFVVGADDVWHEVEARQRAVTPEVRTTFRLWGASAGSRLLWLSEDRFQALPKNLRATLVREQVGQRRGNRPGVGAVPSVRAWSDLLDPGELRRQADGHRFVWWPSLVAVNPVAILHRLVETDRLPSRHAEVTESTWHRCANTLPAARRLAGTWPTGSNGCCFSTVMAAAGADDSAACDSLEPFVDWLATRCRSGGDTSRPGTVLVWRNRDGDPVHAAVSIGDDWALEKPSDDWHSPRAVARVADVIRMSRSAGQRLERHTIVS